LIALSDLRMARRESVAALSARSAIGDRLADASHAPGHLHDIDSVFGRRMEDGNGGVFARRNR
jgi:hypothetical protein